MQTTEHKKRGRKSERELLSMHIKETNETPEHRVKRIAERFTVMYKLAQGSALGHVRSLIISGAPGVGKSYTIEHLLDQYKGMGKIEYEVVRGSITPVHLYKLMYRMRNDNCVILIDDCDDIYNDETSLNLLKAGLDTTHRRRISWLAESNALGDVENQFEYKGSMIFITNLELQGISDMGKSRLAPHFAALLSRSLYLDLKLHTPKDLLAWINHMVTKNGILIQDGLTPNEQATALQYLNTNYERFRDLSIRSIKKIGQLIKLDSNNWQTHANVVLLR